MRIDVLFHGDLVGSVPVLRSGVVQGRRVALVSRPRWNEFVEANGLAKVPASEVAFSMRGRGVVVLLDRDGVGNLDHVWNDRPVKDSLV